MATWYRFQPGRPVQVQFLQHQAGHQSTHWINSKTVQCAGGDCGLCKAGIPVRERDVIDAMIDGVQQVLTLPTVAYDQLISQCISPGPLKDSVVEIIAQGEGQARRYAFSLISGGKQAASPPSSSTVPVVSPPSPQPAPPPELSSSGDDVDLTVIAQTLRMMAEQLDLLSYRLKSS